MVCSANVCDTNEASLLDAQIVKVMAHCGYEMDDTSNPHSVPRPLTAQLIELFLDYAASGIWADIDAVDAEAMIETGEITFKHMINALRAVR